MPITKREKLVFIVTLAGSPKVSSRSSSLLRHLSRILATEHIEIKPYAAHDFDAHILLSGDVSHASIQAFQADVARADGVVIATPVYQASISGVLKTLLDVLPQQALANKTILPLASAGSLAHLLALDYALKPVLGAMKAQDILSGVFAQDAQIHIQNERTVLDEDLRMRLEAAAQQFTHAIRCRRFHHADLQAAVA